MLGMTLLDEVSNADAWDAFARYKQEKGHLSKGDGAALAHFITEERYLPVAQRIQHGLGFDYPQKLLLNKIGTNKKRVVYSFSDEESWTLKLLAWLLYRYDDRQPEGCYSFRRDQGVHKAIRNLIKTQEIGTLWCYKLDISNYFNSIQVPLLLPILHDVMGDDPPLLAFLEQILTADKAYIDGDLVTEERGAMAGTATSPFFANLYLRELDGFFVGKGVPYARYSDDVILFAKTAAELESYKASAHAILKQYGLTVNEDKETTTPPGGTWEFLGISFCNGTIDLSQATKEKIKGKIRRKARSLRRWMLRKEADPERAMRAFIRAFNRKFFDTGTSNDLTWSRWFFPLLTVSDGLREVDAYLQHYVRYIPTGRFNHANYRTDYKDLKRLGYRSLVHEYYEYHAESKNTVATATKRARRLV
jgi:hypothetical protein